MCSVSAAGSACSTSELESLCQRLEQYVTWKGKHMPSRSWRRALKTDFWTTRLYGRIWRASTGVPGVEQWISLLRDSRASRGASQVNGEVKTTSDGSGPISQEWFARWDPKSCSWRTYQGLYLTEDSRAFWKTWPRSGSMRSGVCWRRQTPARRTGGNGSSFSLWPTPAHRDWRCPNAKSYRERIGNGTIGEQLPNFVRHFFLPYHTTSTGGEGPTPQLSPRFVEWLMGMPGSWTLVDSENIDFERWVTDASHLLSHLLG